MGVISPHFESNRPRIAALGEVDMPVSKEDREDYEEGLHDRSAPGQGLRDFLGQHPDSDAYYKGRDGEQLDEDKDK